MQFHAEGVDSLPALCPYVPFMPDYDGLRDGKSESKTAGSGSCFVNLIKSFKDIF